MRKNRVTIRTGTSDDFFDRVRGHAKKLDRGESLPAEITITFENPAELLCVLTSERVRLLRRAKRDRCPSLTWLPA
jgi:predicted transcriptional regulator